MAMVRSVQGVLMLAASCVGINSAQAQYYAHSDFGGYTYRSPYRNSSFAYRFDTGSLYTRNGRLSNTYDSSGAAGLMSTGPTLRPTSTGVSGASISSLGPSLSTSASRSPWTPSPLAKPQTQNQPPQKAPAASGTSAAQKPATYTPYSDQAWTARRRLYRTNR
jgi:hypothetical protein